MEFDQRAFYDRIMNMAAERHMNNKEFAAAVGCSPSLLSDWKVLRSSPRITTIAAIASFFNVSTDYLIFGSDEAVKKQIIRTRSQKEKDLMDKFRSLSPDLQDMVLAYTKGLPSS